MSPMRKAMLFREVNERIADLLEQAWPTAPGDFLCECGRDGCLRRRTLGLGEYRALVARGGAVLAAGCGVPRSLPLPEPGLGLSLPA